jgi:hypothetical protein
MSPEQVSNISVAIVVAVVALVATILGAIIGAATNYVIAVKRERLERRKDAIELKRAARLIREEFAFGASALAIAINKKQWWSDSVTLSSEAWDKYSATIAAEVSDELWYHVLGAQGALRLLNNTRTVSKHEGTKFADILASEPFDGHTTTHWIRLRKAVML